MLRWHNRTSEWIENRNKELKADELVIYNQKIRIWLLSLFLITGQVTFLPRRASLDLLFWIFFIYKEIITPLTHEKIPVEYILGCKTCIFGPSLFLFPHPGVREAGAEQRERRTWPRGGSSTQQGYWGNDLMGVCLEMVPSVRRPC